MKNRFLSFFTKKKQLFNYIVFLEKYKEVVFNLNFLRNSVVEIQVFNQALNTRNDLIDIDDETGLSIVFSFSDLKSESFLKFK